MLIRVSLGGKDTLNVSTSLKNKLEEVHRKKIIIGDYGEISYHSVNSVDVFDNSQKEILSYNGYHGEFVKSVKLSQGFYGLVYRDLVDSAIVTTTIYNGRSYEDSEKLELFYDYQLISVSLDNGEATDSIGISSTFSTYYSPIKYDNKSQFYVLREDKLITHINGFFKEVQTSSKLLDFTFDSKNNLVMLYRNSVRIGNKEVKLNHYSDQIFIDAQDNLYFASNPGFRKASISNYSFRKLDNFKGYEQIKQEDDHPVKTIFSWTPDQHIVQNNELIEIAFCSPIILGIREDSIFQIECDINCDRVYPWFYKKNNVFYGMVSGGSENREYILRIDSNLTSKAYELQNSNVRAFSRNDSVFLIDDAGILYFGEDSLIRIKNWESFVLNLNFPSLSFRNEASVNYEPIIMLCERKYNNSDIKERVTFNPKTMKLKEVDDSLFLKLEYMPATLSEREWLSIKGDSLVFYDIIKGYHFIKGAKRMLDSYGEIGKYAVDKFNNLYFTNSNGLFIVPNERDTIYKPKTEGDLFFRNIKSMVMSGDSSELWFLTTQGLHSFELNEKTSKGIKINSYVVPETQGYRLKVEGDTVVKNFNVNGIAYLKIGANKHKPKPPKIHFTGLRKDYLAFDWSQTTVRIDTFSGNIMPYNMQLSYDQNHLTFDYQGVSHSNKKPLAYFHQLVGLDTNFVGTTSKSATYSNLEPGDYTFKVFAQDENENKSRIIECSFAIAPPYWETWWFISLCVLAIGSTVYSAYECNIRRLKARQAHLEEEVDAATIEIREQKNEIEEAHREITDSITYAKRIQGAILPPLKLVKSYLDQSFILYKPKDIVAGDFYWMHPKGKAVYFAAADCTGHGVPGAMISVVCNNALNRSVNEFGLVEPGEILDKTRELVIHEFEKSEEEVQDGMDIALCSLNGSELKYSGAHNPLWLIRKGTFDESELPEGNRLIKSEDKKYQLAEIKANKQPIGKYKTTESYTTHTFKLKQGDALYIFSDGFVDQFGGEKGKKFKSLNFKRLLLSLQEEDMDTQQKMIDEAFQKWKSDHEQIDDVCVIGVRV